MFFNYCIISVGKKIYQYMWHSLKASVGKTYQKLSDGVRALFSRQTVNTSELETLLINADFGMRITEKLLKKVKYESEETVLDSLRNEIEPILRVAQKPFVLDHSFNIVLVCGVNGSGKTTTIAKLGKYLQKDQKVAFVAGDTFRAAAVEQLNIWAALLNITLYQGQPNQEPASVVYQSIEKAKQDGIQTLIIDTAGRLHNKADLLNELEKIVRIIKKHVPEAPHETLLILDATTGQNIINQVRIFSEIAPITGLIMTKLDGTAKGGLLVSVADQFKLPIYFIGNGEKAEDLEPFDAESFTQHLIG